MAVLLQCDANKFTEKPKNVFLLSLSLSSSPTAYVSLEFDFISDSTEQPSYIYRSLSVSNIPHEQMETVQRFNI